MANLIKFKQIDGVSIGEAIENLPSLNFKNVTIFPGDTSKYSLIVSGAVAIVDATNISDISGSGGTTIPGQIWAGDGNPPTFPAISGAAQANIIDGGDF